MVPVVVYCVILVPNSVDLVLEMTDLLVVEEVVPIVVDVVVNIAPVSTRLITSTIKTLLPHINSNEVVAVVVEVIIIIIEHMLVTMVDLLECLPLLPHLRQVSRHLPGLHLTLQQSQLLKLKVKLVL